MSNHVPVAFSAQDDEVFIDQVQRHRVLYDTSHAEYKNATLKDTIWNEIAQNVGKSVEDCKKRWKNIRDSYNRNKRKLATGCIRSTKRKWPLAVHISFLDEVEHERSSTSNVNEQPDEEEECEGETAEEQDDEETINHGNIVPERLKSKNDKLAIVLAKRSAELMKLIERIQTQNETLLRGKKTEDDDIDLFFKSLAKTVKKLPGKGINEVKLKALVLVTETEEKYLALQQHKAGSL